MTWPYKISARAWPPSGPGRKPKTTPARRSITLFPLFEVVKTRGRPSNKTKITGLFVSTSAWRYSICPVGRVKSWIFPKNSV